MKADLQAAGEEVRHLRARLAADSARLQGCKAKRALSSTPRRSIDGASHNGIARGRGTLSALGVSKFEPKTERTTRGLLVGYLTYQLLGDKKYKPFAKAIAAAGTQPPRANYSSCRAEHC